MPYRTAVALWPSPRSWGKTNQIQWLRFLPLAKFRDHRLVDPVLRVDKALQVERICTIR